MFKIAIRSFEDETFHDLPVRFATREEAEEAIKHMFVQVRSGGEYIHPEEFEFIETSE